MKQFLLFGGDTYYPSGGWGDFIQSFNTNEEAQIAANLLHHAQQLQWYHIVDIENLPEGDI